MKYRVHVSKLDWTELWLLAGESLLRFFLLIPVKIFGASWFDKVNEQRFDLEPLTLEQVPAQFRAESGDAAGKMAAMGFSFLFADIPPASFTGCTLYFQNAELVVQYICRNGPPVITLITFMLDGRILVTSSDTSGIGNGGLTILQIVRNRTCKDILQFHRHRFDAADARTLSRADLITRLEQVTRKVFEFNLSRGVYEVMEN
ncbi:MAG TPA: hypothetical protein PLB62_04725 [Candidatus Sumerlaeota bacterium]|nr:hypothetical protein [Candidatus Sumerlaeota bacterium]